jgi:hypothetical protein
VTGKFTVAIQGHEDWGGCLVFGLTDEAVIVATPPDQVLEAFPLAKCRVVARFDTLEERTWWNAMVQAGNEEKARLAAQEAQDGAEPAQVVHGHS